MFTNIHLKYRIFLAFVLVSLFSLVVGTFAYVYLQQVVTKYDHVVSINMGNIERMADMKDAILQIRREFTFIVGFPTGHEAEVKESIQEIAKAAEDYRLADKAYNEIPFVEGEAEVYNKIAESMKKLRPLREKLLEAYQKEGASEKVLAIYFQEYNPATLETLRSIDDLIHFQEKEATNWSQASANIAALATKVIIAIMALSFIISLIIATFLVRSLTGQLTSVIDELNQTTPQLSESSTTMSSLSTELSSCATEQAAAVQETASSLEEISAMIRRNSDNANNAKASSTTSLDSVKSGQQAVHNMLNAMEEINQNNDAFNAFMERNNSELNEMVQVITNISDKTKVINDIVFQTKLLSFNASVEAARAGEQGKGFAVVAEEVGNLAQMSGNAANEIKNLLDESIVKVNKIVTTTKTQVERLVGDGKDKIKLGVDRAKECNLALDEINQTVSSVESLVSEVAHASGEQSQGIEEVNKAMGQIDEVTNQNTIASQSVSTNAAQVMELSNTIKFTSEKLTHFLTGGQKLEIKKTVTANKNEFKKSVIKEKFVPEKKALRPSTVAKVESKMASASVGAKKKSAGELHLPSHDDSRFEDV